MTIEQQEQLDALLALEEGLDDWELEFVESLSQRNNRFPLSEKQATKLEELYTKHC